MADRHPCFFIPHDADPSKSTSLRHRPLDCTHALRLSDSGWKDLHTSTKKEPLSRYNLLSHVYQHHIPVTRAFPHLISPHLSPTQTHHARTVRSQVSTVFWAGVSPLCTRKLQYCCVQTTSESSANRGPNLLVPPAHFYGVSLTEPLPLISGGRTATDVFWITKTGQIFERKIWFLVSVTTFAQLFFIAPFMIKKESSLSSGRILCYLVEITVDESVIWTSLLTRSSFLLRSSFQMRIFR